MTEMSEFSRPPQSYFERTLELFADRLHDPNKEFMVFPGDTPSYIALPDQEQDFSLSKVPEFEVLEKEIGAPVVQAPGADYMGIPCKRWLTTRPENITTSSYPILKDPEVSTRLWQIFRGGSSEARLWVIQNFTARARTVEEVASLLRHVLSQYSPLSGDRSQPGLSFVLQAPLLKSINFVGEDNAQLITTTIKQAIAALPDRLGALAYRQIYMNLGKAVRRVTLISRLAASAVKQAGPEKLSQSIKIYDDAGLLDERFWAHFGVQAVAALHTPAFAPLLRDKLAGPNGARIMQHLEDPVRDGRAYITAVLTAYERDPRRHKANASRILKQTHPKVRRQGDNVDLSALVQEANLLASSYNREIDNQGGDDAEKYAPLADDPMYYADAFLRVLSIMRRPDIPQRIRGRQLEQDTLHAEIVSLVFTGRRPDAQISRADLSLRFPDLTVQQVRVVADLVELGMPLREAVESPFEDSPGKRDDHPKS